MRLRINKNKDGSKNYYVLESFRKDNNISTTRIVRKLGNYNQIIKEHPYPDIWAQEVVDEMNRLAREGKQKILIPFSPNSQIEKHLNHLYDGGYLFLQKLFYQLNLDYICTRISSRYSFQYNLSHILGHLIYSRILNPLSKLATYDYVQTFLEKPDYALEDVYRALEIIGQEKDYIQSSLYKFSKKLGNRNDNILYYDCTNYYFEIEQERGLAKYGNSKDNKPNPIVEMGLFMDGDGIPLAFCLHNGNTNEQKTLQPLEKQVLQDFGKSKVIICTDAGLSSVSNRKFNDVENRAFITTQSIKKMKSYQKAWALSPDNWRLIGYSKIFNLDLILSDKELIKKYYHGIFFKEEWFNENDIEQKYIVTFSLKYMDYQRQIRNEQIMRAEEALKSPEKRERTRQSDYKRFIKKISVTEKGEVAGKAVYELAREKIKEEEKYDGFYAVATNLDEESEEIIRINRRRWEIEECFRIMKHEFNARPVYLLREKRITAHFTICFLALVLFRYIEKKLGHQFTCEEIIKGLRDIKFLRVKDTGYIPAYTRNEFTDVLHETFGFRTDFEILSKSSVKKIISITKKK